MRAGRPWSNLESKDNERCAVGKGRISGSSDKMLARGIIDKVLVILIGYK